MRIAFTFFTYRYLLCPGRTKVPKYLSRRLWEKKKKGRKWTEKKKKKIIATRGKERDGARGCGVRARDRKAGGKTAHAPSSSTWRITCCPLLKLPCLHLPPLSLSVSVLLLLRVHPRSSGLSLHHLQLRPTLRRVGLSSRAIPLLPSPFLPSWRTILSSWCNVLSHIAFNYNVFVRSRTFGAPWIALQNPDVDLKTKLKY